MKFKFYLFLVAFGLISCSEKVTEPAKEDISTKEQVAVSTKYRPLLHLFTSTGCGGCGRFGIPVFSEVAQSMGDSILALPTHFKYNDKFINTASLAIEKAVVKHYSSPQIWVNMKEITYDIIPYNQTIAKEKTRQFLREEMHLTPEAFVGIKAILKENGRYNVELAVRRNATTKEEFFYEVYAMEDGLIGSQAGADPFVATHCQRNSAGPSCHAYFLNGAHFGPTCPGMSSR